MRAALEAAEPLEVTPAEVLAERAGARLVVDLLEAVLPNVADRERPRRAVEREAPRVAQSVRVDLTALPGAAERVAARDPVAATRVRVDPQDLAEQRAQVLAGVVRVALAAAVAHAD